MTMVKGECRDGSCIKISLRREPSLLAGLVFTDNCCASPPEMAYIRQIFNGYVNLLTICRNRFSNRQTIPAMSHHQTTFDDGMHVHHLCNPSGGSRLPRLTGMVTSACARVRPPGDLDLITHQVRESVLLYLERAGRLVRNEESAYLNLHSDERNTMITISEVLISYRLAFGLSAGAADH